MSIINIITYHYSNNVGAMLQAYGLANAIERLGHSVGVIDYRPPAIRKALKSRYPRHPIHFVRNFLYRKRIRDFREGHLPLTRTYLNPKDLVSSPLEADCYVCGSDQVWNISSKRGFDPCYFLDFIHDDNALRVSYAPSFGNGTDLGIHKDKIAELLSRFDQISVRDKFSQDMVRSLTGREATHVLDPCFLTDYNPITPEPVLKKPYVLAYLFRATKIADEILKMAEEHFKMPIIRFSTGYSRRRKFNPGPLQWLSLMKHAAFIITNSFHGTCFALINKKHFVVVPYDKKGSMTRIVDILENTWTADRYITDHNSISKIFQNEVDYHQVGERIDKLRTDSLGFLESSLKT